MLVYFSYNTAGISHCHTVLGYIFCNNAAGAYYNIITYCNTGQDKRSRTYPTVFSYVNRSVVLISLFSQFGKYWVPCRCNHRQERVEHALPGTGCFSQSFSLSDLTGDSPPASCRTKILQKPSRWRVRTV